MTLSRTIETSKIQAAKIVSEKNLKLLNWTENLLKVILKIKDVFTVASVNHLDEHTYCDLKSKPILMISSSKTYSYGGTKPMKILGQFGTLVESVHAFEVMKFHVVEGNCGSLLSYQSAKSLHIIDTINAITCNLKDSHANLFRGIGTLKSDPIKLHINNDINPSVQRHRRIPFHVRKKVEDELLRLEKLDIIEKVEGPTPWISPIVVLQKKNDSIGICVDMRLPNKAIERERHITPTIDDIITEIKGAQLFSKFDLNNGYHQLVLHEESRYITTFTTHVGLRRYKRLMFGINAASEIFQIAIYQSLHGLSGVINVSDDILVYGNCKTSHDENLKAVPQPSYFRALHLGQTPQRWRNHRVVPFTCVIDWRVRHAHAIKIN